MAPTQEDDVDLGQHAGMQALVKQYGAQAVMMAAERIERKPLDAVTRAYLAIESCETQGQVEVADRYATLACRTEDGFMRRQRLLLGFAAARARRRLLARGGEQK